MNDAAPPDISDGWMAAMRRGDWAQAWRETDRIELVRRRQQLHPGFERRPEHLVWDGTPFAGRRVLVRCEHGLGDTIQFIRFVPLMVQQAREVHVMIQPALLDLFAGGPGLGSVHNGWTQWWPPPAHDLEVEVMELAYAFRSTVDAVPPPYPHLAALAAARSTLAVPQDERLRIGIVWAASDWDTTRSVPLPALEPLLGLPGTRWFSLQQGTVGSDPLVQAMGMEPLARRTAAAVDAAAAMVQLDLVITVDSMVAHLAGTLGRPTWVLLKREADWRWMDDRSDSPWYPAMRLFRQQAGGDWRALVHEVAHALRQLAIAR